MSWALVGERQIVPPYQTETIISESRVRRWKSARLMPLKDRTQATSGLLIIADSTGIPVLVRACGDTQSPPSAAVGIISAVSHAAESDDGATLVLLASRHRRAVYTKADHDFLLVFVTQDDMAREMITSMLQCAFCMLRMLLGDAALASQNASSLRPAIARHAMRIDTLVCQFRKSLWLVFTRPVCALSMTWDQDLLPVTTPLLLGMWVADGIIVREVGAKHKDFAASELAILMFLVLEGDFDADSAVVVSLRTTKGSASFRVSWQWLPGHGNLCFIALFDDSIKQDVIQVTMDNVARNVVDSSSSCESPQHVLVEMFPPSLVCCFITPTSPSRPTKIDQARVSAVIPSRNGRRNGGGTDNATEDDDGIGNSIAIVCQYYSRVLTSSNNSMTDWIQRDEMFTFISCIRSRLSIFAVFADLAEPLTLSQVHELGDKAFRVLITEGMH